MAPAELPHTRGCLACGRENPHGIYLQLHVDEDSGLVTVHFTPTVHQIGFEGIVHGGLLATVLDEAMVWAATWHGKRFCVCGEMNVRFRQTVQVGTPVRAEARVTSARSRLIETQGFIRDAEGGLQVESSGKYLPMTPERHQIVVETLMTEPATERIREALGGRPSVAR